MSCNIREIWERGGGGKDGYNIVNTREQIQDKIMVEHFLERG